MESRLRAKIRLWPASHQRCLTVRVPQQSQKNISIFFRNAYRTFKMFSSFGMAELKVGRMGEYEQALESSICILE